MDPGWLRGLLVLYALVSAAIIWVFWRNAGGENSVAQLSTLFGALAVAFVAVAPYLKQEERHTLITAVLFRDTEKNVLLFGGHESPYFKAMWPTRIEGGSGPTGMQMSVSEEDEIQFLEYRILESLMQYFFGPWDGDVIQNPSVHGTGDYGKTIIGATSESEKWPQQKLAAASLANKFIASRGFSPAEFSVPPGMRFERKDAGVLGSTLVFKVDGFEIDIVINGYSRSSLNGDVWGLLRLEDGPPQKYMYSRYSIMVLARTDKWRKYPASIKSYWKWYDNTVAAMKTFDWGAIDAQMVDDESRRAYWRGRSSIERSTEWMQSPKGQEYMSDLRRPKGH